MHILHVTLGFYPALAWGGPVKTVHRIARELVRRGHQVTVYCTNLLNKREYIRNGTFEDEIDGIRVVYFHTWRVPWWPGTLGPIWLPQLPQYLAAEINDFDVVHLNGYRVPMFLPVVQAAQRTGVPFVTQPHGTLPVIVSSRLAKKFYDRLLGQRELHHLSTLVALQESERQQALAHNISPDRIKIVPIGLDLGERTQLPEPGSFRRDFGLPNDAPLILFLARINKKKGADMLVEAFAQLNGLKAKLAIVGPDDGQLNEVKELIRKYRLEQDVILPGLLSGKDVWGAYQDADLFVLPCRADTFPATIMEACLAGTPMVVTDRCEIAHLVQNRVADVVPFDAAAFAAAIKRLLTDKDRYNQYQAACQTIMVDTFSLSATVEQLEGIYERVLAEKK